MEKSSSLEILPISTQFCVLNSHNLIENLRETLFLKIAENCY